MYKIVVCVHFFLLHIQKKIKWLDLNARTDEGRELGSLCLCPCSMMYVMIILIDAKIPNNFNYHN